MRRNVVLPQPRRPDDRDELAALRPRRRCRAAHRARRSDLRQSGDGELGGHARQSRVHGTSSPSSQVKPAVMTMPATARTTTPANSSGMLKAVGRLADQPAEAGARAEQFGDHDADQAAADAELQSREHERRRRRQRHLAEDLPLESRRSCAASRSGARWSCAGPPRC